MEFIYNAILKLKDFISNMITFINNLIGFLTSFIYIFPNEIKVIILLTLGIIIPLLILFIIFIEKILDFEIYNISIYNYLMFFTIIGLIFAIIRAISNKKEN